MAITTENQKRAFIGIYPLDDGALDTAAEKFQMIDIAAFSVIATIFDSVAVTLALSILTGHTLTLSPNNLPLILEDLDHDLKIH